MAGKTGTTTSAGAPRGTAVVTEATGSALVPTIDVPAGTVVRGGDATLIANAPYGARGVAAPTVEAYDVEGAKSRADGPWPGEADKITWRDEATGYEWIMPRSATTRSGGWPSVHRWADWAGMALARRGRPDPAPAVGARRASDRRRGPVARWSKRAVRGRRDRYLRAPARDGVRP